ncbi:hypothetical protein [Ketogulonicigenium vulgare]|uniref:Uncharacterized protein n=1 Tax=Ketogulonicigenium vulgare (strain WSH-001) TaxID=759362 RepID=F9YB14_KETVW|nr:hypothetical protein [Ketogulonicigenium vulgare]ADO44038.1 hypothetical protein EIO_2970 [Ketogulonicigenium vulgare Y25]AEM42566.1 hypothetical protein KVU_PA0147 [Ketogulonicigenium vulgare WSH-001]ALJ82597.1 hypothetical protein KVH_14960 [Ketogulonicigenium vulgare]ANW35441.1 hypothetical protein KvSKV_14850 [Ketogulonicigenium vulgare]AOZ53268.1 hypothetical protein KVC_0242 [Ketogulonicigenium vulgare]
METAPNIPYAKVEMKEGALTVSAAVTTIDGQLRFQDAIEEFLEKSHDWTAFQEHRSAQTGIIQSVVLMRK